MSAREAESRIISIVLANLREPWRQKILNILESNRGFKVLAKPENEPNIAFLVEALKPDILIVDLTSNSTEIIDETCRIAPKTKLILVGADSGENGHSAESKAATCTE